MFSNSLFVIIRLFQLVIHNKDDSMNRKTKQNDIFSKKTTFYMYSTIVVNGVRRLIKHHKRVFVIV